VLPVLEPRRLHHAIILAMRDDTIQDLKQFISATVSQQASVLRADIRADIENLDKKLSGKIDDLSASVAEAIDATNESTSAQLSNHEERIVTLEHKAARL
jgi:hypothetical protein